MALVIQGTTVWGEVDIAENYSVNIVFSGAFAYFTIHHINLINGAIIQTSGILSNIVTVLLIDWFVP